MSISVKSRSEVRDEEEKEAVEEVKKLWARRVCWCAWLSELTD